MKVAIRNFLFMLAGALLVQVAAAQVVPHFSPFSADMQMTSTRPQAGMQDSTGKIYVGNGHMRLDMSSQGHDMAMITDFATKTTDMLMVQQKMYIEHNAGQMAGRGPGGNATRDMRPYDPEDPCANQPDITCKKIGVETVSGRTCDHWEITDKKEKVSNVWVDQKLHFPIKTTTPDSTILLSNINEGEPEASLFQVPSDFRKMDMGGMMPPGMGGPPHN
jgi:Domain of unknown function (DUF4412)